MIRAYTIAGLSIVLVAVLVWANGAYIKVNRLQDEVFSLEGELETQKVIATQAVSARNNALREAARQSKKAAEYDAIRAALLKGDQDAQIPDWFRAFLDSLLHRPAR